MLCLSFEHINLEICYKQFLNDTEYVYKTPTNNLHPSNHFPVLPGESWDFPRPDKI